MNGDGDGDGDGLAEDVYVVSDIGVLSSALSVNHVAIRICAVFVCLSVCVCLC